MTARTRTLVTGCKRGVQERVCGTSQGTRGVVAEFVRIRAASSVSIDLHVKLHAYRRNHVREYLVWRVQDQDIDWFVLREGDYQRLAPDPEGVYQSQVFPGMWLDAAALLRGALAVVLQVLQRGRRVRNTRRFWIG
jgi:hypothetical protein